MHQTQLVLLIDDHAHGPYDDLAEALADLPKSVKGHPYTYDGLPIQHNVKVMRMELPTQKALENQIEAEDFYRMQKEARIRIEGLIPSVSTKLGDTNMNDTTGDNNDPREAAADPPSAHATPGGQPGDHSAPEPETETVVETPGGTTVTETSSDPEE